MFLLQTCDVAQARNSSLAALVTMLHSDFPALQIWSLKKRKLLTCFCHLHLFPYKFMWKISCMTPKRIITTRQTTVMVKKGWITCHKAAGPPSPTWMSSKTRKTSPKTAVCSAQYIQKGQGEWNGNIQRIHINAGATNITQNSQNHPRDQFNTPIMSTTDFTARLQWTEQERYLQPPQSPPPTHISHTPDRQEEKASTQKNHETIKRHGYCELQNAKKAQDAKANYWSCSN